MAHRTRPTLLKREREKARVERQKSKQARREEKAKRPATRSEGGVDPDIAHIQPGPQPLADWQIDEDEQ
jgi:hypothetical protein